MNWIVQFKKCIENYRQPARFGEPVSIHQLSTNRPPHSWKFSLRKRSAQGKYESLRADETDFQEAFQKVVQLFIDSLMTAVLFDLSFNFIFTGIQC